MAVHCVTAAQLVVTLAALRCGGCHPSDRIEHAAVVPDDCLADLAASGTTVVTQPNFVAERGDQYLADVPTAEHHELWRVASLRRAGVPVALSTDSPFGDADPGRRCVRRCTAAHPPAPSWARPNASRRQRRWRCSWASQAGPRSPARSSRVQPGDLCVLSTPPAETLGELDSGTVAATVIGGDVVFERR